MNTCKPKTLLLMIIIQLFAYLPLANATIVQFETALGNFEVNLFDEATPQTVANFLSYVKSSAYQNTLFHRSESGFIVQGGGFTYAGSFPPDTITANTPVNNEPVFSNLRGTIAMAKLGNDANSATVQWFFNLADNSANLDTQNSGFAVFGQVLGDGMQIVDTIAALQTFNAGGAFTSLPVQSDPVDTTNIDNTHLVIVNNIQITDATVNSAVGLQPTENTLINQPASTPDSDSGGGNISILMLLLTLLMNIYRIKPHNTSRTKN